MQAVLFHNNHVCVAMVFANLLKLPILFLAASKKMTEDSNESKTIIFWNHILTESASMQCGIIVVYSI